MVTIDQISGIVGKTIGHAQVTNLKSSDPTVFPSIVFYFTDGSVISWTPDPKIDRLDQLYIVNAPQPEVVLHG